MTDYPDWNTPQANATAIAGTGVPLLSSPANLVNSSLASIPAAGNEQFTGLSVTQTGYAAYLNVKFPVAATVPFVQVELIWIDTVTGNTCATENYITCGADGAAGFQTLGGGIAKADSLNVIVTNLDPAQAATVTLTLNQDSVTRAADRWYWRNATDSGLTIPGYTLPSLPNDESVLGIVNSLSVSASSNADVLFGMAPGKPVNFAGFFSGIAAASVSFGFTIAPTAYYSNRSVLLSVTPASTQFAYTFIAPRAPMLLQVSNNATTGTLSFNGCLVAQS